MNNKQINHADIIHHHTKTYLKFWDRVKVLFGKPLCVDSEIFTKEECNVVGSEAKAYVPPLIKRKKRLGGMEVTDIVKLTGEQLDERIAETRTRLGMRQRTK